MLEVSVFISNNISVSWADCRIGRKKFMTKNIIVGLLAVGIVVLGGFYIFKNKADKEETTTKTTPPVSKTSPAAPISKPDAPTVVTGANPSISSSTAIVSGQIKPNGVSTSYWFEYGETTALGSRTISQQIGSGYSMISTPAYITGLRGNTVYYFRLSAKNSVSTVDGTTYTFKTNNNPPPSGSAPTARTNSATNVSRTTANLNGAVDPQGSETNFWFEYGKDTGLGNVTVLQSTGNGNSLNTEAISVSGLDPSTKYYFRMNAQNQYGTVNGSTLNFTTEGPINQGAPIVDTNQASNIGSSSARLNGRINPNGAETDYWFEYSQDSLLGSLLGGGSSIKTLSASDNNVDVELNLTGLSRDTTYYYHLVGRNSYGTVNGDIRSFKTRD